VLQIQRCCGTSFIKAFSQPFLKGNIMTNLTTAQKQQLTTWARNRLCEMMERGTYEGDNWFTVDENIPSLCGKIDVNIWDDGEGDSVKAAAYVIDTLPDGTPNTNTEKWVMLFGE
jgi:hypothetical protein